MELRTGKYTNFILTVIAALLLALVFQTATGLVGTAHAQRADEGRQAVTNSVAATDPAIASGLQSIASAIREVATALNGVASGNQDIASAISRLELSATAPQN
ncbi:MAG: hypothetical protein HUU25_02625 [Candidatus Sumerlaeia bacterium]|nr:hypothetical protein [Candidatus Sumerlaeia bacterium]